MKIIKVLAVVVAMIFMFNGSCPFEFEEEGTPEDFDVEYDFMYADAIDNYDCLPGGYTPVTEAFNDGNVIANIWFDDTLGCNTYPPDYAQLAVFIHTVYDKSRPWYLQGGMAPESGASWAGSDVYGVTGGTDPYYSFSLVFVWTIKNDFPSDVNDACIQTTIHELGHQYAHLSDKYLHPEDHATYGCCVMDALYRDQNGSLINKCLKFCTNCVDSIKKVHWSYNSYKK